jgi:hypothetical protein
MVNEGNDIAMGDIFLTRWMHKTRGMRNVCAPGFFCTFVSQISKMETFFFWSSAYMIFSGTQIIFVFLSSSAWI